MAKKIMAWSKCDIKIGPTGEEDAMAATLTSVGVIKDKSSTLEPSDGETLEAKATGGETVAKETQEGGFLLKTRIIEQAGDLYNLLGIGEEAEGVITINTHVVEGNFSVEVTPKNVGARGLRAPKTSIAFKPGWSEEEGHYVDLEFEILKGEAGYWYKMFTKQAASSDPDDPNGAS